MVRKEIYVFRCVWKGSSVFGREADSVVFWKFKITIVYKEAFHFSLEVEFYFST